VSYQIEEKAMSGATLPGQPAPPEYDQLMGHPRPLWMLFMAEFWERFAFYGIRWALVLYIVAQFHGGDASGQQPAGLIYGSYLALVYAGAIFGGYVADKFLGYQRSILVGAVIMAAGLFMISIPNEDVFKLGLATACSSRSSRPWSARSTRWVTVAAIQASPSSTWASTSAR
jgi:proton-dependent oligopeptide transporter, POT family